MLAAPDPLPLCFDPSAYRDAVAAVSAYAYREREVCEEILATGGRDVLAALVVIQFSGIAMLADERGVSFEEMLESLGAAAEHFAAGGDY